MTEEDRPPRVAVSRLRNVLAGGSRGSGDDWATAAEIEAAWPGTGELVIRAHAFHRRAAAWAVTETATTRPAQAVVFSAAGLPPPDGPLHAWAARLAPQARFAYVHGDPTTALIARAVLEVPGRGRVTVIHGEAESPESWLGTDEAQKVLTAGPVSVQVVLAAHRWPSWLVAQALTAYRRYLPSGSTVCMTMGSASGPRAGEYVEYLAKRTGPVFSHSPEQVAGWVGFAGLRLHPRGVTDVGPSGRTGAPARAVHPAARVIEVVALVPLGDGVDDAEVAAGAAGPVPVGAGGVVGGSLAVDGVDGEFGAGQVDEPAGHLGDALGEEPEADLVGAGESCPDLLQQRAALLP
ncbi:MAG: SAM-dependent methyltransferase [Trebonia sp.]